MANGRHYAYKRRHLKGKTLPTLPRDTTANKAVKRVYKKKAQVPKTQAGANKQAVYTLSRQVKSLQNLTHGYLQSRTMNERISGLQMPHYNQPLAFGVNNMYNNQPIWQGLVSATGVASNNPVGTFNKAVYDPGLQDQYEWNARSGNVEVSPITYKPVYTRLNFKFGVGMTGTSGAARARITLLKLKKGYEATNKINVAIPDALGAYQNLAIDSSDPSRNFFSPRFHNILYDKWISIPNVNRTDTEKSFTERYVSIPYKYADNERLKPDFNNNPTAQSFWTNVPIKDQIFCLISVNRVMDDAMKFISLSRLDSWRDFHGIQG